MAIFPPLPTENNEAFRQEVDLGTHLAVSNLRRNIITGRQTKDPAYEL